MNIYSYTPDTPLDYFVYQIWYAEADSFSTQGSSFPILNPELIFNFSDHFSIELADNNGYIIKNLNSWVGGLHTRPIKVSADGKHKMLGVLFKPWGLQPLIKLSAQSITNKAIDSTSVFGQEIVELHNQLWLADNMHNMFVILEKFLLDKYLNVRIPTYFTFASGFLNEFNYNESRIKNLVKQLDISHKTLIHSFKKYIGLTPHKLIHLTKLNEILLSLASSDKSMTELAYDLNFSDQPHFNHFFKSFTGITPFYYQHLISNGYIDPLSPTFVKDL